MEVLGSQQPSSEEERRRQREGALSLIEGDSDDIDILPSWLHFGLTQSFKGFCQTKVGFSKGTPQARLDSPTHIHTHTHTHTHTDLTSCSAQ